MADLTPEAAREALDAAEREVLLTVKEYADIFRRHEQTIYRAIYRDKLPYPIERPSGGRLLIRVPADTIKKLRAA